MIAKNRVLIAAAGSGKTTFLAREALKVSSGNVLITTYTESNEAEVRRKIFELNGCIPPHIFVTTWFSFLIKHGVRPFQGCLFEFDVRGLNLATRQSGFRYNVGNRPVFWGEENFNRYYFDDAKWVYSDKLSKLVLRCDAATNGCVFDRISRIYQNIFIDEVQDLAGYDLDILVAFFKSPSNVLLVGDPRQVTYLTHHERRYGKYANGKLVDFLVAELPKGISCVVDELTLQASHRNNAAICAASSKLYPAFKASTACACGPCRSSEAEGAGLFVVRTHSRQKYLRAYQPVQLRWDVTVPGLDPTLRALNFGESKGLGFDHVAIYPTAEMVKWMKNNTITLKDKTKAKFYVALTRARHSVGVMYDFKSHEVMEGFAIYE